MLDKNTDRFAFSLEDIEPFTGKPLRIDLNSDKPIFCPPHKLGQVERDPEDHLEVTQPGHLEGKILRMSAMNLDPGRDVVSDGSSRGGTAVYEL